MDEIKVHQNLDMIVSQPISAIGRFIDMLRLGIGDKITTIDWRGREVENTPYALHVQYGWRIVNKEKKEIVLASSDIFCPSQKISSQPGFVWEEFEWESEWKFKWNEQGNNLFDEKSQIWLKSQAPVYVKEYRISPWGDLTLFLSNGELFQVFVNSSEEESWRLLMGHDDSPHLVITGLGAEERHREHSRH